jgi:hypothetical protein
LRAEIYNPFVDGNLINISLTLISLFFFADILWKLIVWLKSIKAPNQRCEIHRRLEPVDNNERDSVDDGHEAANSTEDVHEGGNCAFSHSQSVVELNAH